MYKIPAFEDVFKKDINYNEIPIEGLFWDSKELDDLNKTIIDSTLRLRKTNELITKYDRKKTQLELEYKHAYREELFKAEGKTESQKKLVAEMKCEPIEMKLAYATEMVSELTRESYTIRAELDTLKNIGHNARQELRIY